jgi:hypothetical protein
MTRPRLRRALGAARDRIVYRLDQVLDQPPIVQIAMVILLTVLLVAIFAWLTNWVDPQHRMDPVEALWWTVTRFLDGGTMAGDERANRLLSLLVTGTGILVVALLTAFLSSKMSERLTDLRSGLNAVVERDHLLCLGYDANVPLLARELARSGQRCTLVVLTEIDKDRIEVALRAAQRSAGSRLRVVVRTGDPRTEQALLRVAAHRAKKALILPPANLDDDGSVRWTLGTLLALRRVVGEDWKGSALVLARHLDAVELLTLATGEGVAGEVNLRAEIIATDAVVAGILAQSTRERGVYQVLRHLLAFDGCELYSVPVPGDLLGRTFAWAHAAIEGAILVGLRHDGVLHLCPDASDELVLCAGDSMLLMSGSPTQHRTTGRLPPAPLLDPQSVPPVVPEVISIVGCTTTLPHLLRELSGFLPTGSRVRLILGEAFEEGRAMVAALGQTRLSIEPDHRTVAELAHDGEESICRYDAVVILGQQTDDDANGDASALATLLRLRRGMRLCGTHDLRVVTEVRDPRSAAHIAPRPSDCIVSSDVVAMLIAQELLDESSADLYRELLHPGGAYVSLRSRDHYLPPGSSEDHTFAALMAAARAQGDVALGYYPDPRRPAEVDRDLERQRLEEGDPMTGAEAWLNPPRDSVVPSDPGALVAVLTRRR